MTNDFKEQLDFMISTKKYINGFYIKSLLLNKKPTNEKEQSFYDKFISNQSKYQIKDESSYSVAYKNGKYSLFKAPMDLPSYKIYNPPVEDTTTYIPTKHSSTDIIINKPYIDIITHKDRFKITEDDIICLECGAVIDVGLSVVSHADNYVNEFTCPTCMSANGKLARYNSYTKSFVVYC